MSNENELLALTQGVEGTVIKADEADVENLLKSPFLPRLQVCGGNTEIVKEGKMAMGVYGLIYDKNKFVDLGKEVDILVVGMRPKALRLPKEGNPMSYFKRESAEFKKIQADSKFPNSGCMFGMEFLVWIPSQAEWATLFLGTQSARKETPSVLTEMKKDFSGTSRDNYGAAKVTCHAPRLVKNPKGSWHIPQFGPCNSDLAVLPERDSLAEEIQKFASPPESVEEKATGEERAR